MDHKWHDQVKNMKRKEFASLECKGTRQNGVFGSTLRLDHRVYGSGQIWTEGRVMFRGGKQAGGGG